MAQNIQDQTRAIQRMINEGQTGLPQLPEPADFDQPINPEQSHLLNKLLNKDSIDQARLKKWWFVFSDDIPLSFLDENRKGIKMLQFELTTLYDNLNRTESQTNWNELSEHAKIRLLLDARTDRSMGGKPGMLNERSAQISQFSELRHISEDKTANTAGRGLFSRIFGRRN